MHVIDLENLMGTAKPTPEQVRFAYAAYALAATPEHQDRWVLGTSYFCAQRAWLAWPTHCKRVTGSGPDGADLALLSFLEVPQNVTPFSHITIGSGDGIFATRATELRQEGIEVTVVSRPSSLSGKLAAAASAVRHLMPLDSAASADDLAHLA